MGVKRKLILIMLGLIVLAKKHIPFIKVDKSDFVLFLVERMGIIVYSLINTLMYNL